MHGWRRVEKKNQKNPVLPQASARMTLPRNRCLFVDNIKESRHQNNAFVYSMALFFRNSNNRLYLHVLMVDIIDQFIVNL